MVGLARSFLVVLLVLGLASLVSAAHQEVTEPEKAQADPDYAVQGEYVGLELLPDGKKGKVGAQVVALGGGKFDVYVLTGGLPGEGWKRGSPRVRLEAEREGDAVQIKGDGLTGTITKGKLTLTGGHAGKTELERAERKSPTLGAKPPKGAVVLFDGSGADYFPGAKMGKEKTLVAGATSKAEFGSYRLHLEFRLSWMPTARGQGRSNSGVYVHDCYEVQVLDSFGLEGRHNECGGLYRTKDPDVNMCLPPMVWQTYDVEFTAPKYDGEGKKVAGARMTLRHNGVVVHDKLELPGACPGRKDEGPGPRGIHLQGHGCHVQYRNIWLEEGE